MKQQGKTLTVGEVTVDSAILRCDTQAHLAVGQWYWVTAGVRGDPAKTTEWFGCLTRIGSNYVEIKAPSGTYARVHEDDLSRLRYEEDPDAVIRAHIAKWQAEAQRLIDEVKALTERLSLRCYALPSATAPASGSALVPVRDQLDVEAYKHALTAAKEETLPQLYEAIGKAQERMAAWMSAQALPLSAFTGTMKQTIGEIDDRIFDVGLYAGLAESAVLCADGACAPAVAKLHVMQRRLYMDEECLLNYEAGGMELADIDASDAWITREENRERILPFPRTLVAMRVRRFAKDRPSDGGVLGAFIRIFCERADKRTFLYIRNGDQVWRIACDMEFGEMLFPDVRPGEAMMVRMFANRVDKLMSRAEYDDRLREHEHARAASEQWKIAHPFEQWIQEHPESSWMGWQYANPYDTRLSRFNPNEWKPLDRSNLYYDEAMGYLADQEKAYNRVALIIQGLFDRSRILHPHKPVTTWTREGFEQAIRLIYDAQGVLDNGSAPDFEAYRAKCNQSLSKGSITVGQDAYWQQLQAEKEARRRARDWRLSEAERDADLSGWRPYGNSGPGYVAVVQAWQPRACRAKFGWRRKKLHYDRQCSNSVGASISVPQSALLNITAYKPGDFRQFFQDHRTRDSYLKWAPMLLAAEDYHAGRLRSDLKGQEVR